MSTWCLWLLVCCILCCRTHATKSTTDSNYFVDAQSNCNNVYGAISEPNESTQYVAYLGQKATTKDCIETCIHTSNSTYRCESYTFHTKVIFIMIHIMYNLDISTKKTTYKRPLEVNMQITAMLGLDILYGHRLINNM